MGTWVALLRGVNVGGHNKLPMADLRDLMQSAGFGEVATYIQSGNVVFDAPDTGDAPDAPDRAALEGTIAREVASGAGIEVPVVVRSAAEISWVAAAHPFEGEVDDEKSLLVAFLSSEPSVDVADVIDLADHAPDDAVLRGRELYLCYPNGAGNSRLTNDLIGRRLGVSSTMRNWRTVNKLAGMASGR